jgi:TetR/AcrR family transcriptional repressor of nem operon
MLAAEYQTLPEPMRDAVIEFFDENEAWVGAVLEDGRDDGSLAFEGAPRDAARLIVSALEGAMLVARPYGDVERFELAAERLLTGFSEAP